MTPSPDESGASLIPGERIGRDRDVDMVLITGAGASREFGVNDVALPLMGDWSDALVKKLSQRGTYLEATGLQRGMSGEEFEAQLGKFLQLVEAFGKVGDLLEPSTRFQDFGPGTAVMSAQGVIGQWHKQAVYHLGEIVTLVRQTLYELFGDPSVDLSAAAAAYQGLFQSLGLGGGGARLVYATTNYDTIGEHAIRRSGGLPDWGQPPSLEHQGEHQLVVSGLLSGLPRYVPVLHLHGRVGWYRREDGTVYGGSATQYQSGFGLPIVMLPDPDKVYDQDDIIMALWQQFAEALRRAKRVFVLGHSLNDRFLLRALTENVEPLDRIAVTVLSDESQRDGLHGSARPVVDKIANLLGNATVVPMRFGAGPGEGSKGIRTWTETLAGRGLLE